MLIWHTNNIYPIRASIKFILIKPPVWAGFYLSHVPVFVSGFLSHLLSCDVPQCLHLPDLFSVFDIFYPFCKLLMICAGQ